MQNYQMKENQSQNDRIDSLKLLELAKTFDNEKLFNITLEFFYKTSLSNDLIVLLCHSIIKKSLD